MRGVRQGKKKKLDKRPSADQMPLMFGGRTPEPLSKKGPPEEFMNRLEMEYKKPSTRVKRPPKKPMTDEPVLFELPGQETQVRRRVRARIELVRLGGELSGVLEKMENIAGAFAAEYFSGAKENSVLEQGEVVRLKKRVMGSPETGIRFRHPHIGVIKEMGALMRDMIDGFGDLGSQLIQDNVSNAYACLSSVASMARAEKGYWLLRNGGVKLFLRNDKEVERSKSTSNLRIRKSQSYVGAVESLRGAMGEKSDRAPEPHPKMKRLVELVADEVEGGGHVLVYAKLSHSRIGRIGRWEEMLAKEIRAQLKERLGKTKHIVMAKDTGEVPEGDVIISTKFFGFSKIDTVQPPLSLIVQYDQISRGNRDDLEEFPVRTIMLVSKE